jgi:hypothetical protein
MAAHNKDMRQDRDDGLNNQSDARNRANQDAASRPGVDAEHGLDDRGHMVSNPRKGSAFEPMREGSSGADRDQNARSGKAGKSDPAGAPGNRDGVNRRP